MTKTIAGLKTKAQLLEEVKQLRCELAAATKMAHHQTDRLTSASVRIQMILRRLHREWT